MKVKVLFTTSAEIEVSDNYENMLKLNEKHDLVCWYVWKAMANSLERELTWKLPKEAKIQKVLLNDAELYEN